MKCLSPICNNEVPPERAKYHNAKTCSSACSWDLRRYRAGRLQMKDDFNKYRKGTITLPNGVEIRNDAMGKEIANRMFV